LFEVEYGSGSGHSAEDEGQPNFCDQIGFARKAPELSEITRSWHDSPITLNLGLPWAPPSSA